MACEKGHIHQVSRMAYAEIRVLPYIQYHSSSFTMTMRYPTWQVEQRGIGENFEGRLGVDGAYMYKL